MKSEVPNTLNAAVCLREWPLRQHRLHISAAREIVIYRFTFSFLICSCQWKYCHRISVTILKFTALTDNDSSEDFW